MDQSGSRHDRGAEVTPSRFPRRLARPILNLQEVLDDDDEAVGAGPSPSAVSAGGRRAAVRARAASARADGAGDVCRRPLLLGCVGVLVGLVLVVLGVARSLIPLAVVGFVLMLAGAAFAAAPERKPGPVGMIGRDGTPVPRRSRGGGPRGARASPPR